MVHSRIGCIICGAQCKMKIQGPLLKKMMKNLKTARAELLS